MTKGNWDWDFGKGFPFGPGGPFGAFGPFCTPRGERRKGRRQQVFEPGDLKFVILRLLKDKPSHGYEIMKALEEKLGGWYTASPGTIYPTLQLLEDQGLVRSVETEGKKVYHITAEGERYLVENRGALDEIMERLKDLLEGFTEGASGDLLKETARMWAAAGRAMRYGDPERTRKAAEVVRKAVAELEGL